MGGVFKIDKLTAEDQERVDGCIRANRYKQIDKTLAEIEHLGISGLSRSGLQRYMAQLKATDPIFSGPENGTIVTIIERRTGEVRIVRTTASATSIAAMIEKISAPLDIS